MRHSKVQPERLSTSTAQPASEATPSRRSATKYMMPSNMLVTGVTKRPTIEQTKSLKELMKSQEHARRDNDAGRMQLEDLLDIARRKAARGERP